VNGTVTTILKNGDGTNWKLMIEREKIAKNLMSMATEVFI